MALIIDTSSPLAARSAHVTVPRWAVDPIRFEAVDKNGTRFEFGIPWEAFYPEYRPDIAERAVREAAAEFMALRRRCSSLHAAYRLRQIARRRRA